MCIRNQLLHLVVIIAITVLFKNTWTLKFKSQLTFAFYSAVNHPRKQNLTYKWDQQAMVCDLAVIGGFCYVLRVSVFQGLFLVIIIMIDGSENRFQLWRSRVCEKRSKVEWLWSLLYLSETCFIFFFYIYFCFQCTTFNNSIPIILILQTN